MITTSLRSLSVARSARRCLVGAWMNDLNPRTPSLAVHPDTLSRISHSPCISLTHVYLLPTHPSVTRRTHSCTHEHKHPCTHKRTNAHLLITHAPRCGRTGSGFGIGAWGLMGNSWGPCGNQLYVFCLFVFCLSRHFTCQQTKKWL
jgi:hypothetical protein